MTQWGTRQRRGLWPRQLRMAGAVLLAGTTMGMAGCAPVSHEPKPMKWEGGEPPKQVAQAPTQDSGGGGQETSSDQSSQVDVCAALDPATVQEAFGTSGEPTPEADAGSPLAEGLGLATCTYGWSGGQLVVGLGTQTSDGGAGAFVDNNVAAAGLNTDDVVDGLGAASVMDSTESAVQDSAVAVGVSELDGSVGVVLMIGPLDAEPSTYAELGQPLLDQLG